VSCGIRANPEYSGEEESDHTEEQQASDRMIERIFAESPAVSTSRGSIGGKRQNSSGRDGPVSSSRLVFLQSDELLDRCIRVVRRNVFVPDRMITEHPTFGSQRSPFGRQRIDDS